MWKDKIGTYKRYNLNGGRRDLIRSHDFLIRSHISFSLEAIK